MKDFHDLRTLSVLFPFAGDILAEAIRRTFERRQTALTWTALPAALSPVFYDDETKQKQWNAFVTQNNLYVEAISRREVVTGIGEFILPIVQAEAPAILTWSPVGPREKSRDQA